MGTRTRQLEDVISQGLASEITSDDSIEEYLLTRPDQALVGELCLQQGLIGPGASMETPVGAKNCLPVAAPFIYTRDLAVLLPSGRWIARFFRSNTPCYVYVAGPRNSETDDNVVHAKLEDVLRAEGVID